MGCRPSLVRRVSLLWDSIPLYSQSRKREGAVGGRQGGRTKLTTKLILLHISRSGTCTSSRPSPHMNKLDTPLSTYVLPFVQPVRPTGCLANTDRQRDAVPVPATKAVAHDAADGLNQRTRLLSRRPRCRRREFCRLRYGLKGHGWVPRPRRRLGGDTAWFRLKLRLRLRRIQGKPQLWRRSRWEIEDDSHAAQRGQHLARLG